MQNEHLTFDQWYRRLKKLAKASGFDWLISADKESYREYFDFGSSPQEMLDDEIDEAKRS